MKKLALVLGLALFVASPAFAFRCGTRLVAEGDSRAEVVAKCGEPADIATQRSVFRRPVVWTYGRPYYIGENYIEVDVENWTYNLGPHKLMRRLRFEGGVLADIETLGYGYND